MSLQDELLEEIVKCYKDEARDSVLSIRLSRNAAANLKALGGTAVLNYLLLTPAIPTLVHIRNRLGMRSNQVLESASEPDDVRLAATNISVELYYSLPYFRWASERVQSTKMITLGMLRKMFMVKGLVDRNLIEGNLIFASLSMIDRYGSASIARYYKEGEVIEPWVYLGSDCFIRLYQLLYFLKSFLIDELPDSTLYRDDIRVPVIPIMPYDGDVTSAIEISNGGRIDVKKSLPEKYCVVFDSSNINQLNLFGERWGMDYGCLPFFNEAFRDMHPDLEFTNLLDVEKAAHTMMSELWCNRVENLSNSSVIGVKNVMYQGHTRAKPWMVQPRLKGGRDRQYLGSYQHVNDAIYASIQYHQISDLINEADMTAQLGLIASEPLKPAQQYLTEWADRFSKSQELLKSWITQDSEEYDHHVKGVILRNREKLESLLSAARQESFKIISDTLPDTDYGVLEEVYSYESKWTGHPVSKPFYDEKLFYLSLQGIDHDQLQEIAASLREGGSQDLPRLFPEYNFGETPIE